MKKYELTQEQINQLAEKKHAKELLKEFIPEAFENELEVGEIWKPIHNYEEFYEVSNYGNVRTIPRQVKHSRNTMLLLFVEIIYFKRLTHAF